MPAPSTTDEFLDLVRKSGLVDPERLDGFAANARRQPADEGDPKQLAALLVGAGLLTQFQAEQFLLGKWRGFTIGKYKVLERLGFGGNGTVYLCEHLVMHRKVAVKVLPATKADNPAALGRFYREARASGILDHPNLVKAHDIDQDGPLHFLVMEYVDGSNLQEIVSKFGPLAVDRAAHYIRQTAQALQHAHQVGLIHRDVKPANILIDRTGTVRVLDLGLARFFRDQNDPLTLKYDEKNVLGTADYVSPEQALNSHEVDIRADVYSLGATFYYLLTGQPPFPGGKAAQKLIWHQVRQPTPVRTLRREVPPELAAIVQKMMAKEPAHRYQVPGEVVEALTPWTRTPLPPPPEAEMPRLSPAAARSVSAPPEGEPAPAPAPRPVVLSTRGAASGPTRAGAPTNAPPAQRHADPTTPRPMARSDTDPVRPRPAPVPRAAAKAPPADAARSSARGLRLAVILLVGAVGGSTLRWGLSVFSRDTQPATLQTTLVVSRSDSPDAFKTVADALKKAAPGDRIVVAEDVWEEALQVNGEDGTGKDVRIEGAPDRVVLWRVPPGHKEGQPLLQLTRVAGLTIGNFTLDGLDRVRDLVAISGACPGLKLEDLELRGFSANGVTVRNAEGDGDLPLTLQSLRIRPAHPAASAVRFEADAEKPTRHVRVTDCRLEGPYQAAVSLAGPSASLELQRNRIFNVTDGVVCRRGAPAPALGLALLNNTFCEVENAGLRFEATPPEGSRVVLNGNLFAHTGTLGQIDDFSPRPPQTPALWIWLEESRPGKEVPVESRYFRKTFTVDNPSATQAVLNVTADASFTAWINGERVGSGEFHPSSRRVYSFDASRPLRRGHNVLAVQATNRTGVAGLLAQLTCTCAGSAPVTVATNTTWKVSRSPAAGWLHAGFEDDRWAAALAVGSARDTPAWHNLVWDSVVLDHFKGKAAQLFPEPVGNVRDLTSQESFPPFRATPLAFDLPADASDDARFLRYTRANALLLQAGSPGVPPAEKRR
jgi:serine/threonine protein kinase